MQTEEYRRSLTKSTTPEFKRYSGKVHRLTRKTYEKFKDEINPMNHPRGTCGVDGAYQLDHKISIRTGFDNGLAPEILAEKDNLQMLPWHVNLKKSKGELSS